MKRTLSLLLAFALCLTLLPTAAAADAAPSGYYLVGSMTDWELNEAYALTGPGEDGGYTLMTPIFEGDQFRIYRYENGAQTAAFPEGGNYNEDGEIDYDGNYVIRFYPNAEGGPRLEYDLLPGAGAGISYGLWVGGVQVTSANKDDLAFAINENGGIAEGSITFDPSTNTLTLVNAVIGGGFCADYRGNLCTITTKDRDPKITTLTIAFSGENTVSCDFESDGTYFSAFGGVKTALIFDGADDAVLTFRARTEGAPENGAIGCASVTVNGGTVVAECPTAAYSDDNPYGMCLNKADGVVLTVNGGTLICKGFSPINAANFSAARVSGLTELYASENADGSELEAFDFSAAGQWKGCGDYRYVKAVSTLSSLESATIADDTATNRYVPIHTYFNYGKTQFVIPSSMLEDAAGRTIRAIRFYLSSKSSYKNAKLDVRFKEIEADSPDGAASETGFVDISGAQTVYTGSFDITGRAGETLLLTFTEPYAYQGGNLLVTVFNDSGHYGSVPSFYGTAQENGSVTVFRDSVISKESDTLKGTKRNFLPKTTLYFEPAAYTVSFDPNGGSGKMDDVTVKDGEVYALPECAFTAPEGQRFKAWSIGGKEYKPGEKITVEADVEAFAIWEDKPFIPQPYIPPYPAPTTPTEPAKPDSGEPDDGGDEPAPYENPFVDVSENDYFAEAVRWAVGSGVTSGTDETHFDPNAPTSRAQMITFLWRAAGCPAPQRRDNPFADVQEDSYYAQAVLWGYENGIIFGVDDTHFDPDAPVTRAQTAVFLYRYIQYTGGGFQGMWMFLLDYADREDIPGYAYEAMCYLVMHDILSGTPEGLLLPLEICPRAQIVSILFRYFGK